jgi:hypothetical protein
VHDEEPDRSPFAFFFLPFDGKFIVCFDTDLTTWRFFSASGLRSACPRHTCDQLDASAARVSSTSHHTFFT